MTPAAACCAACRAFANDAAYLERQLPGLQSLGSGFGAVRSDDGLCAEHGRFVPARAHCARFVAHVAAPIPLTTRMR